MKKIIFGGLLLLSGIVGSAILLAGTFLTNVTLNGQRSLIWSLQLYELMLPLTTFVIVAIAGLALGVWGLLEKSDQ